MGKIILTINIILYSVHSFCQDTVLVTKYFGSGDISEKYYVLKSNRLIKHGTYTSYVEYLTGTTNRYTEISSQGKYNNGKKVGVWIVKTIKEKDGTVMEQFDFSKNLKLNPIVNYRDDSLKYPESARNAGIQGTVYVKFRINKDCSVTDFKILKGISPDCDQAALESVKKCMRLFTKYNSNCKDTINYFPIRFTM